ncbi:MAG: LysM peptidoglycan-binding domain-containing protein, partial [Caldilineaceae bacterium]
TGAPDAAPGADLEAGVDAAPTREGAEMLVPAAAEGATPVPCTPQVPNGWGIYTVIQGDHLTALARATGTTVREIAGANCLVSDVIVIGQTLAIPLNSALPVVSPAAPAELNAAPASAPEPAAP